jgi:hypothetical protein
MRKDVTKNNGQTSFNGVVYRTICQNPGCGFEFDLKITPENAGLLGGTIACPRCRRHGGLLKREQKIGDRRFAAKLIFRGPGAAYLAEEGTERAAI